MLRTQLETAKIEEAKDTNKIQVIDYVVPSEFAAKPNRQLIIAIGVLLSFFISILSVICIDSFKKMKNS